MPEDVAFILLKFKVNTSQDSKIMSVAFILLKFKVNTSQDRKIMSAARKIADGQTDNLSALIYR